jgi:small subunit ribosomal protein S18
MKRTKKQQPENDAPKQCYFCTHGINAIDYKEVRLLQKFVSPYAKIFARRRTGTCMKHQRKLSLAVKRARFLALIAYVPN